MLYPVVQVDYSKVTDLMYEDEKRSDVCMFRDTACPIINT